MNIKKINYDEFKSKYSENEFKSLIALIPNSVLIYPIRKSPKEFKKDYNGFRIETLPTIKLHSIYFKRIYNDKDSKLFSYFLGSLDDVIKKTDREMEENNSTLSSIRKELEKKDKDYLKVIVNSLLQTKFRENVLLYFKIINYEFSVEEEEYLNDSLNNLIEKSCLELKIREEMKNEYDEKIKSLKIENGKVIKSKEVEIINLISKSKEKDKQIKKLEEEYKQLLDNQISLSESNNYKYEKYKKEVEQKINKLNVTISNLDFKGQELFNQCLLKESKVKEIDRLLELKHEEFSKYSYGEWEKRNLELVEVNSKLEDNINKFKEKKSDLQKVVDEKIQEIEVIENEKKEISNSINYLKKEVNSVIDNIKDVCDILGIGKEKKGEYDIYINGDDEVDDDIYILENQDELLSELKNNLSICGILDEYLNDLNEFIYSILVCRSNMLMIGYNARKVANAISSVIDGKKAEIINLPCGYNNIELLITKIKESNSKVILLENVINTVHENIYISLIKEIKDKIIIFSVESYHCLNVIPEYLLNYMIFIDLDSVIGEEKIGEFALCKDSKNLINIDPKTIDCTRSLRDLRGIEKVIKISNISKIKLAKIMEIIKSLDSDNSMYDLVRFTLGTICIKPGEQTKLKDFIGEKRLTSRNLELLQDIFGDENDG